MDVITSLASTVIFLFADGQVPIGTGFVVGYPMPDSKSFIPLIVTAKHVIGDRTKVIARFSTKEGKTTFSHEFDLAAMRLDGDVWQHPDPGVDITVFRTLVFKDTDFQAFPSDLFVSKETLESEDIKATDRVIFPSLLVNFMGLSRNYPTLRDGSIAVMPKEKIPMKYKTGSELVDTRQEVILINGISIPGASGSPVFLYPGPRIKKDSFSIGGGTAYLIGVMHGFYNAIPREVQQIEMSSVKSMYAENSGIAIVFPAWRIKEIFSQPAFIDRMNYIIDHAVPSTKQEP